MKQSLKTKLLNSFTVQKFLRHEDGAMTIFGLFMFLLVAIISAIAVDISHLFSARNQMQIAADATAHAAIYTREMDTASNAKAAALELFDHAMPSENYGSVLTAQDIQFGTWSYETSTFTPSSTSRSAVMVTPSRLSSKSNSVASFLFQLVGKETWDVVVSSVFTTFRPGCLREGFVADDIVDLQGNNNYSNGFCLHSNNYISANSNNSWETGTIVSMPEEDDIDLPNSGFETNDGLEPALRSAVYRLRILNRIEDIISGLATSDPLYTPEYITSIVPIPVSGNHLDETDFEPGRIHILTCHGNPKSTINASATLTRVVIISNCELKFSAGSVFEDVVIATTNTNVKSINSPSTLQVGRDDGCSEGGGAQFLTMGGMNFASDLRLYGGQLLALDDIEFSANANGVEGASIVSGGVVSGTSNMNMAFCGTGMEGNFEADYFRLAG